MSCHGTHQCALGRVTLSIHEAGEDTFFITRVGDREERLGWTWRIIPSWLCRYWVSSCRVSVSPMVHSRPISGCVGVSSSWLLYTLPHAQRSFPPPTVTLHRHPHRGLLPLQCLLPLYSVSLLLLANISMVPPPRLRSTSGQSLSASGSQPWPILTPMRLHISPSVVAPWPAPRTS